MIEIVKSTLFYYNGIIPKKTHRKKIRKFTNIWKLNIELLNNQQVKEEIIREIRKYSEMNENENTITKIYEMKQKKCLEGNL